MLSYLNFWSIMFFIFCQRFSKIVFIIFRKKSEIFCQMNLKKGKIYDLKRLTIQPQIFFQIFTASCQAPLIPCQILSKILSPIALKSSKFSGKFCPKEKLGKTKHDIKKNIINFFIIFNLQS